jgi:hypothetical protein
MATASEIQSLDEIQYKSKIKVYLYPLIISFIFMMAFLNFYPIGTELKGFIKNNLKGTACNPDWDDIRIEMLLPKLVITDLKIPASCMGKSGDPLRLSFVTVNFHLISFSPIGIPFKIETEMNAQPLTLYFIQGFGERMIRIKDQTISMARLQPVMGDFKMGGNITVDMSLLVSNNNQIKTLAMKAESKDFQIPSQNLQGFTTPNLKINTLALEANSDVPPRVTVDKLFMGDTNSPMRAQFKGHIDLQNGAIPFSPLNLTGEIAFSEQFKQQLPLIDMMFQSFTQKDGFYQIRLGGTLGAPKPSAP